jgi:hypothetical protein
LVNANVLLTDLELSTMIQIKSLLPSSRWRYWPVLVLALLYAVSGSFPLSWDGPLLPLPSNRPILLMLPWWSAFHLLCSAAAAGIEFAAGWRIGSLPMDVYCCPNLYSPTWRQWRRRRVR